MDGKPKHFILILIAAFMLIGSVITASATVTITGITPGTGTVYSTATITGTCSSTIGTMTIDFGTVTVGTVAVIDDGGVGSFTCVFTVPLHVYGTETITATHDGADGSATTTFFVIPQVVSVTPISDVVGTIVTISGTGYAAGDTVTVTFGANTSIKQVAADAS
ncbi:MAG: hypothetical protein QME49_03560, partial [bacterium]|nr:hypothetical protein [bacterium]